MARLLAIALLFVLAAWHGRRNVRHVTHTVEVGHPIPALLTTFEGRRPM